MSIRLSARSRPGKRSRTITQAVSRPSGTLTKAASAAAPKLSFSAASTRGSVIDAHTPAAPSSHGRRIRAVNGSSTIKLTQRRVSDSDIRNPGRTRFVQVIYLLGT